jgi:8-oxo-dGTP pyrophosphatase MutT (NUDIX family)
MRWRIHDERQVWGSRWLDVRSLDVEQPNGTRCVYHAVRLSDVAAAVVLDGEQRVLMLWRHRFLTDTWAWDLPMGIVEPGETPEQAAAREVEEETGWRPGPLTDLVYAEPAAGIMDAGGTSSSPTQPPPSASRWSRTSPIASSGSPSPPYRP